MFPLPEAHAEPQSCWKNPRPMIPLAPRAATPLPLFGPVVRLEQLLGTGGETLSGIAACAEPENALAIADHDHTDCVIAVMLEDLANLMLVGVTDRKST